MAIHKIKHDPKINTGDIYKYIENNSSLTRQQAKECFDTYRKMIDELLTSHNRFNDLVIAFPKLGNFYFIEIKGRKSGSTYKVPKTYGSKEIITVTVDKEPNFARMKFKTINSLEQKLKEVSSYYAE